MALLAACGATDPALAAPPHDTRSPVSQTGGPLPPGPDAGSALTGELPVVARAAGQVTVVPQGGTVLLPAPGAIAADSLDPGTASAHLAAPGLIAVTGIVPGSATVIAITPTGVETLSVTVRGPVSPLYPQTPQAGSLHVVYQPLLSIPPPLCPEALLTPFSALEAACHAPSPSGLVSLDAVYGPLSLTLAGSQYRVAVDLGGRLSLTASSALPTPFDPLTGTPPSPGATLSIGERLSLGIAGGEPLATLSIPTTLGQLTIGLGPAGPGLATSLSIGSLSLSGALAWPQSGPPLSAVTISALLGHDISVSLTRGPAGDLFTIIRYQSNRLSGLVGVGPSGLSWGLGYTFSAGASLTLSATPGTGPLAMLTLPLGPGTVSVTSGPGETRVLAFPTAPLDPRSAVVPLGTATLSVTVPPLPPTPTLPTTASLTIPLEGPTPMPVRPAVAPPSAILLIHACLTTHTETSCRRDDQPLGIDILVDDQPTRSATAGVPVAPGSHTVIVPVDAVPFALTPITPLRCDVSVGTGQIAECDFVFRRP